MSAFQHLPSLWQSSALLAAGAGMTIAVSLAGNALGLLIAVPVCLLRLARGRGARAAGSAYVSFFRGVPLLVQLLVVYYFLPALGLDLPPFVAAAIGLAVCTAAYQAENLRGGFLIIPAGQIDAARAFGYNGLQRQRYILIPQALRAAAPTVINEMILILKASSLVSVVGVADLMRVSQNIVARELDPIRWYTAAALIYLVINLVLALLGRAAERRLNAGYARGTL
ncbi:MAG TPA: amino acid ABC transporter permease [Alphaproteobacteria bacterium]|nr:amino acid ABC transporter permease [Alphaproteobacteria bacterium]